MPNIYKLYSWKTLIENWRIPSTRLFLAGSASVFEKPKTKTQYLPPCVLISSENIYFIKYTLLLLIPSSSLCSRHIVCELPGRKDHTQNRIHTKWKIYFNRKFQFVGLSLEIFRDFIVKIGSDVYFSENNLVLNTQKCVP